MANAYQYTPLTSCPSQAGRQPFLGLFSGYERERVVVVQVESLLWFGSDDGAGSVHEIPW